MLPHLILQSADFQNVAERDSVNFPFSELMNFVWKPSIARRLEETFWSLQSENKGFSNRQACSLCNLVIFRLVFERKVLQPPFFERLILQYWKTGF